jgi:hypothetical protein
VVVAGLYTEIVEDGLRLHAWREPQLVAIERQLKDTDLLWPVMEAFREERAATIRTFETTPPRQLVKLFAYRPSPTSWRELVENSIFKGMLVCMPRGWFYQNMAAGARLEQEWLPCVDATNRLVLAGKASEIMRRDSSEFERRSPFTFLVAIALPNYLKVMQTMARNQVLVDEARLACALERYRLANRQYPEALDALMPHFIEKPPHDLIGGKAFKYRRGDGEGYRLYSIGWNEQDDGGLVGQSREEGDWVWGLR